MERMGQRKTIDVDRGVFLIRYVAAADESRPPKVTVSPDSPTNKNLSFVLHPDHDEAILWGPNACLVVRALTAAKLCIEVERLDGSESIDATVRVERLTQGEAPSWRSEQSGVSFDPSDFRIIGHIASIGDVVVNSAEWLAGPLAPSRVEGLGIEWPSKPESLDIRYSVRTGRPHTISDRVVGLGSFVGTRGKAMPLVGVMLELSGYQALDFEVEAIFLGAPTMRATGKRVVLAGPTGREPLVGLRVALQEGSTATRPRSMASDLGSSRPSGRVRVFRSRPKQAQAVEF
jgi:hypothetical protein